MVDGAGAGLGDAAEQAIRAIAVVVPTEVVEDRIEAQALDRHAVLVTRLGDFLGHIVQPHRAVVALGARLRYEHGAAVALVHLEQRLVLPVAKEHGSAVVDPLVVVVIVDADDIDVVGPAPQLRGAAAGDHVEGLELPLVMVGGDAPVLLAGRSGNDVDERFGEGDAGARIDIADRFDRGDGAAYEDRLQLPAAAAGERIQAAGVAARPGPEADLVHRRPERHGVGLLPDQPGDGPGVGGEAVDEARFPYLQPVGDAVVQQVPDHLRAGVARGPQHGEEAVELIAVGATLDEVPADGVADGTDAVAGEQAIVFGGADIVLRRGQQVEPLAGAQLVRRALEAAEEKALEQRRRVGGIGHEMTL